MVRQFSFRILVLLLAMSFNSTVFSQRQSRKAKMQVEETTNFLSGTRWKVDGVPFADKDRTEYSLSAYEALTYESQMGHFISFDEKTFVSDYNAPCGMDCFTSVTGEYWFKTGTRVHIKVLNIERHGYCDKSSESINRDYGFFDLVKAEKGWKLVKAE